MPVAPVPVPMPMPMPASSSSIRDNISTLVVVEGTHQVTTLLVCAQFHILWMKRNPHMRCYSYIFDEREQEPSSAASPRSEPAAAAAAVTKDHLRLLEAKCNVLPTVPILDWNSFLLWLYRRQGQARQTPMAGFKRSISEIEAKTPRHYNAHQATQTDVLHIRVNCVSAKLPVLLTHVRSLDCRVVIILPATCLQTRNDFEKFARSGLPIFSQLVVTVDAQAENRWLQARFHGSALSQLEDRRLFGVDTIPRLECVQTLNNNIRPVIIGECLSTFIPTDLLLIMISYECRVCLCSYCQKEF